MISLQKHYNGSGGTRQFKQRISFSGIVLAIIGLLSAGSICLAQGDIWTTKASMIIERYNFSSCVVNGKIYAIGGDETGTGMNAPGSRWVEEYDPVTDNWTVKEFMPTARIGLSISAVGEKIYAIGGSKTPGPTNLRTVEEYDPALNSWTTKNDMPTARWGLSTSVVNGKIYAIGGSQYPTGAEDLDMVEEYDPATDTWTIKAKMPTARGTLATSVVDGKIYAFGGSWLGRWDARKTVEMYDPATNTWTQKTNMIYQRQNVPACTVNDKIYVIGGSAVARDAGSSTVQEYDPLTNSWTLREPMPTSRTSLHASTLNGKIYAIGGSVSPWPFQPIPIVEEYTPPDVSGVEAHSCGGYNPDEFVLHQNYPNPFNPETSIEYQLPRAGHVKIVVYNLRGQEVRKLIDKSHNTGNYNLTWNGRDNLGQAVRSGVYFYQIQAEGFAETKKMILLQ